MKGKRRILILAAILVFGGTLRAQVPSDKTANPSSDDPEVRPPVTKADVKIVKRAREILSSPSNWNHADTRVCPPEARTFSLYCALEKATDEVSGNFTHRGAAMQEARFVIDEITLKGKHYEPGCGKRRQDKCAIQKSGPHVACESEWPTEKLQVGSQGTFPVLLVSLLTPLGFFCQPLGNSLF